MEHHIRFDADAMTLYLLDQRALPGREDYLPIRTLDETIRALQVMVVRGAPAIGVTAGFGCVLALEELRRSLPAGADWRTAYDRALDAIESYLVQYPSIRFILDIHRDAIADSEGNQYKVVSAVEGEGTAAQLTLVMGSDGSGLAHPDWMENLKLAVAIQERILGDCPTLMRPMLLRNSRYNQHATTGSLLLEVGAAGNSPEEAALAGRLFARQMAQLLIELGK